MQSLPLVFPWSLAIALLSVGFAQALELIFTAYTNMHHQHAACKEALWYTDTPGVSETLSLFLFQAPALAAVFKHTLKRLLQGGYLVRVGLRSPLFQDPVL